MTAVTNEMQPQLTKTITGPISSWAEFEHSEELDAFMGIASRMYELNVSLGRFLQIHVIVDTSILIADLLSLIRAQGQAHRRPAIFELVAKKTLIAYFPLEKLSEVQEKCVAISNRYGLSLELMMSYWTKYRQLLHIVPTRDLERERPDARKLAMRDPSDVPFLQARHIVGASTILSKDDDIIDSGAPVMPWSRVFVDLRHYSRKHGLQAAISLGTGTVILVPIAALIGCVRLIHYAWKSIPREALIVAAVGVGAALLIPQSRALLIRIGKAAWENLKGVSAVIGPMLGDAINAAAEAKQHSEEMGSKLDKELARVLKSKLSLAQACYRACVVAGQPLTVAEVWAAASRYGVKSCARNPLRSVQVALKRHRLLMELPDGRWSVAAE